MTVVRVGSDTGGTFTDVVDDRGNIMKVPSTPEEPGAAVRSGVAELCPTRPEVLTHGTTVATNALLERRGARTALVTTDGFTDVIEIGRQDRPSLYDLRVQRSEPLVPRALRFGVVERIGIDGSAIVPLDLSTLAPIEGVEAVAVALLHADVDGRNERAIGDVLEAAGHDVSLSVDVSPEFREFERTVTTVLNAYLRPVCRDYLLALDPLAGRVLVMTSGGGLLPAAEAADLPVALLLSGPAGGVRAGAAIASLNNRPNAVTFDMGGTSTDVCLILGGNPAPAAQRSVGGFTVRFPALDVHSIGAGGGSIAGLDPGGALFVGPVSAGAVPGPACYGLGGREPTVTDANLVAGHLPEGVELPGIGRLDLDAARGALRRRGITAEGVLTVVDEHMRRAVRAVSLERGVDPKTLTLVAFGGAGPLHACSIADALGLADVLVPPRAGVFSAVGLLGAPERRELVRSWPRHAADSDLETALADLSVDVAGLVGAGATVATALDCRYVGQSHELTVPSIGDFPAEHRRRNGYELPDADIEVVAIRAAAEVAAPVVLDDLPAPARQGGVGPVVLAEEDTTVWVPNRWRADEAEGGALLLTREGRR